jgi:hypothetical protein
MMFVKNSEQIGRITHDIRLDRRISVRSQSYQIHQAGAEGAIVLVLNRLYVTFQLPGLAAPVQIP